MSNQIKSIFGVIVTLIVFAVYYFISTLPQPLVNAPEDYYIRSVTVDGEKIQDEQLLKEISQEVIKYKREAKSVDVWDGMDEQTEFQILGPVSEQKTIIQLGEGVAVCYWAKSQGVFPIIDGEYLYQDVAKIIEEYNQ